MTAPGMAGGYNMPINVDQLTRVVNSLVEVTSGNPMTPLSGNMLMSSPTVPVVAAAATSDNHNPNDNCLSQVIQTQASGSKNLV